MALNAYAADFESAAYQNVNSAQIDIMFQGAVLYVPNREQQQPGTVQGDSNCSDELNCRTLLLPACEILGTVSGTSLFMVFFGAFDMSTLSIGQRTTARTTRIPKRLPIVMSSTSRVHVSTRNWNPAASKATQILTQRQRSERVSTRKSLEFE